MGNVTPDGRERWFGGRYDSEVYVFDTKTAELTARIPVGDGRHGVTGWPIRGGTASGTPATCGDPAQRSS